MDKLFSNPIIFIGLLTLFFFVQILIIRWVFKIDHIVFYLEKINDKLRKLCEEREIMTKTEIEK